MHKSRKQNNLKRYRRIAGFSQAEIAVILGVGYTTTISKWERGFLLPNISQLFTLSILYNTTPQELYYTIWQQQMQTIGMMKSRELLEKKQVIHNEHFYL